MRFSGALISACLWLPLAQGQHVLSIRQAVEEALQSHPLLAAAGERVAVSGGMLTQSGLRPNPRLVLQTENWRSYGVPSFHPGEDVDTFAYLMQPFETGGKRRHRMEFARAGHRRAELERDLAARQIATAVKQAYWHAVGAQRIHELWVENTATFQQIVRYHEHRVQEGAMAEGDLLKVRLEGERLALAANSAALDADRARITLFREMGRTEFPDVRFADTLDLGPAPAPVEIERALADRVEVKLAEQAIEQARANVRLQHAVARPDVEISLGYKRTAGFNTAVGGVQLPLPLFNRNQGSVSAAVAETRVNESQLAAAQALVRAEVRAALNEVEMRRRQITDMLTSALEHARESARIATAAYREGGADLLRLLDAERVRIELEVLYARTLSEYRQSLVGLERAMGVEP